MRARYRTGQHYVLVEWSNVSFEQKDRLSRLPEETQVYGSFLSLPGSALPERVAWRETAILFLHLQNHDHLPHYLALEPERDVLNMLANLLHDHVLEIWNGDRFITGIEAWMAFHRNDNIHKSPPSGFLTELSWKAVTGAFLLPGVSAAALSKQLYSFNTLPIGDADRSRFPDKSTIREFQYPSTDPGHPLSIMNDWKLNDPNGESGWLGWRKTTHEYSQLANRTPTFKLYISPMPEALPAVIRLVVPILDRNRAHSFKTGATLNGLMRPDKMVVYFLNLSDLFVAAREMITLLKGVPEHGVPFTSQLDERGLLSWGVDPPRMEVISELDGGSWRSRLCDLLGNIIHQWQTEGPVESERIPYLWSRLHDAGIRPEDWAAAGYSEAAKTTNP